MISTPHPSVPSRAGGFLAALCFCFGIPVLLWRAAGWPLPRRLPAVSAIGDALTGGWRPDDRVVISVLALVGWVLWAQIAACTAAEIRAARSGRTGRTLPLSAWCRPIAVRLATALVVIAPFTPRVAGATPMPVVTPAVVTVSAAPARVLPAGGAAAPAAVPSTTQATTVHVVCPGDTLWDLAEEHLGDPFRWHELFDTNRSRVQPDGDRLDDPGLLRPGWQLILPIAPMLPDPPDTTEPVPVTPAAQGPTTENAAPVAAAAQPTDPAQPAVPPPDQPAPAVAAPVPAASTVAGEGPEAPDSTTSTATTFAQVGLPSLTAGVLLGYLGALRKDRERRRRRHHRFPKPSPAQTAAERRVRAVARPDAPVWVDLALRHLAASLQSEGAPPPPAVLGVRAGDLGVEVLISPPWPVAPGRFLPVDDGHTWRLDPAVDLEELTALTAGVPAYVPALVTVGDTDSGAVLVDLDEAGTLILEGAVDQVDAVLTAIATELASAAWSENCDVCLVGVGARLGDLDRVRILDADHAVAELRRAASMPGTGGLADGARGDIPAAPTIAVVGPGALEPDDLRALLAVAQPHSGLAVVAAGCGTGGRVRLVACPDSTAVLYPLGLTVQLATGAAAAEELVDLLAATAARGTDLPVDSHPGSGNSSAEVDQPDGSTGSDDVDEPDGENPVDAQTGAETEPLAEPVVAVRVLGPVEITWQGPTPKRQVAELVSYLVAHPRGVTSDQGRLALWPAIADDDRFGERAPATFWSLTTKARRALGQDRAGNALILREANNTLRLSSAVTCDWIEFEHLTNAARSDRDGAAKLLRHALSLVRGRPFEGAAWAWVEVERLDGAMEAAIADAACDLADLALDTSDLETARFAVNQGLLAVPQAEALLRAAMRVAAAAGDRAGVERAWRDARRLATGLDPLGQPEPETMALYQSLRQPNGDA
jgi:DNA-binding SARP family transcriptional activator